MKTQIMAVVTALFMAGAFSAFGQGYVIFGALRDFVYDPPLVAGSEVSVTFLWANLATYDPLGLGVTTTGYAAGPYTWGTVASMLSGGGWNVAENYNDGSPIEVDAEVNSSVITRGGIFYNNGSSFPLANSTLGNSYEFVVVGWLNEGGTITTLEQAEAAGVDFGWDSAFTYATGATAGSAVDVTFNASGASPFGLVVPEPTTLALAGLGALSMLFVRRNT